MKKLTIILASIFMLLTVSCKKVDPVITGKTNTWKVGEYTFSKAPFGGTQGGMHGNYSLLISSTDKTSDEKFIGSILTISFVNKGEGEYTISDQRSQLGEGWDMHILCALQTSLTTMTNYQVELPTTVKAKVTKVTKDKKDEFHVTVSQPLKLVKDKTTTSPDDKSPDSFMLTINDVY